MKYSEQSVCNQQPLGEVKNEQKQWSDVTAEEYTRVQTDVVKSKTDVWVATHGSVASHMIIVKQCSTSQHATV